MNQEKFEIIRAWVSNNVEGDFDISSASYDASFRTYWRLSANNNNKILMYAPPHLEPIDTFLDINSRLEKISVNVPKIYQVDKKAGFILMSDLGSKRYLDI